MYDVNIHFDFVIFFLFGTNKLGAYFLIPDKKIITDATHLGHIYVCNIEAAIDNIEYIVHGSNNQNDSKL